MLLNQLKNYNLILASGSPRRQQFFKDLGFNFTISLKPIDEIFPPHLKAEAITDFLAELKAEPFKNSLKQNDILVTSDTIVWHNDNALGKPKDETDAFYILKSLSNDTHDVFTSVSFTTSKLQKTVNCQTKVTFKALTDDEIWHYINTCKPFDKAGAYGIQEWLGHIAITHIEGSFFNVVGLPTHLVYKTLEEIVTSN